MDTLIQHIFKYKVGVYYMTSVGVMILTLKQ